MDNTKIEARFRAYLDGKMSDRERRAFEEELEHDNTLQKVFLRTTLWAQQSVSAYEAPARATAARFRAAAGTLPIPKLTFFDYLRYWLQSPLSIAALLVGAALAGLLAWANMGATVRPLSALPGEYFIDPVELGVAGGQDDTSYTAARAIFEASSDFYWGKRTGGADSLAQVAASHSGFCMARYYLAHKHLKNNEYETARTEFEACLADSVYINRFRETQDFDKIRFNHLLAELGASGSSEKVLPGLATLVEKTAKGSLVRKKAEALRDELTQPLRFLSFR